MKWTRASASLDLSVVKTRVPASTPWRSRGARPGSWNDGMPAASMSIFSGSTSTPTTSWPKSAMHAAWTAPRYPHPMTEIFTPGSISRGGKRQVAARFHRLRYPRPMRVLVTGGAGFIGSNFVLRARETRPDWTLTVLDAMTYAANRTSLAPVLDDLGGDGTVRLVEG